MDKNLYNFITLLLNYKAHKSYLMFNKDLPEYESNKIWEYIELILNKCKALKLDFILIIDQYKNIPNNKKNLDKIIEQNNTSKIMVCSTIDDYEIRDALINGIPEYINYQDSLITLEDIQRKYKELFLNISNKKKETIVLYENGTRELFDCLNEKDENLENYTHKKIEKIKKYFKKFCRGNLSRISFINFIFRNIDYYWKEEDYNVIRRFIPFKYFVSEKKDSKKIPY